MKHYFCNAAVATLVLVVGAGYIGGVDPDDSRWFNIICNLWCGG